MNAILTKSIIATVANATLRVFAHDKTKKVNPRAVEFLIHYMSGRQTPMTLTDGEIRETRDQIERSWYDDAYNNNVYPDGVMTAESSVSNDLNGDGDNATIEYLCGKTHGLVGGFNYRFDYDRCVAVCWDVWDFNEGNFELECVIPNKYVPVVRMLLKFLPKSDYYFVPDDYAVNCHRLVLVEGILRRYNPTHAFRTEWEVDMTGVSCELSRVKHRARLHPKSSFSML